jgi:hypothetical protein
MHAHSHNSGFESVQKGASARAKRLRIFKRERTYLLLPAFRVTAHAAFMETSSVESTGTCTDVTRRIFQDLPNSIIPVRTGMGFPLFSLYWGTWYGECDDVAFAPASSEHSTRRILSPYCCPIGFNAFLRS